jgi:hypothetical protein
MSQIAISTEVTPQEVAREKSLGDAISLCVKAAGFEPKDLLIDLKWDKGQWSRWESGQEGIVWPKLVALMDYCGNDAPLLWMLHARGYELSSLHKRETETEKRLRLAEEALAKERAERAVERRLFTELRIAA